MSSTMQSHERQVEEIDIKALMYELLAHKWVILACVLFCLGLATVYSMRQVPQYQASVLLQVDSKQPGLGGGMSASLSSIFGADTGGSAATQIALVKSRFVLEPVIESLGLTIQSQFKGPWYQRFWKKNTKNKLNVSVLEVPYRLINKPLVCLVDKPNHIRLTYDNQLLAEGFIGKKISGIVTIKIDAIHAPVGSSFTLKKLSTEKVMQAILSRLIIDESGAKMHQQTGVLTATMTGDDTTVLVNFLNKMAEVTLEKDTAKKAQEAAQTLSFLNQQLPVTKKELEKAEYQFNRYRAKSGKIDLKLQAQFLLEQMAEINKKEGELRIERIEMSQQYTDIHPAMKAIDAQFKVLQQEELELRKELKSLPASDQLAVNLARDVKVRQGLYKILLQKIQELQVIKAGTVSNVRILAYAKLPDAPLPARKAVVYLGGLMCGLLIGVGFAFLRKLLWPKITDPHWVENRFNLPNLATVPYCQEVISNDKQTSIVAYTHPKSLAVESLRSLRTSIQVMLACSSNNVISILGLSPGVGKSFVSANLAYLLAAGGKRVLLIDTDLRKGTLHKYFNVPASPGLAEILVGKQSLDPVVKTSIHDNLSLIPRGAYPSDPSEVLMSPNFKKMIEYFSQTYDVVLFDSAPILLVTDALVVAGHSALNYLVVAAGKHEPAEVELALKRLSNVGAPLQGTVFNFHKKVNKGSYLYYHYGQYYKHAYYYSHNDNPAKISS